jgi:hypothetical protein
VDPRSGLDDVKKRKFLTLPGLKLRPLGSPARSLSLYRLSYLGSLFTVRTVRSTHVHRMDRTQSRSSRWYIYLPLPQKLALTSPTSGGL